LVWHYEKVAEYILTYLIFIKTVEKLEIF